MCDQETFDALLGELDKTSREYERKALRLTKHGPDHPQYASWLNEAELLEERHEALVTAAQIVGAL